MTGADRQPATDNAFALPMVSEHPADLLQGADAVLLLLDRVFSECGELALGERDIYGLTLILGGVQQNVDRALKLL